MRFKDGVVQVRATGQPKLIVVAARGEGFFVFADIPPGDYSVAATNTLTGRFESAVPLKPSIPAQLPVPARNATYRITLSTCSSVEPMRCLTAFGATLQVAYSPYQIELAAGGAPAELEKRRKTVQRFFACRFDVFEWDASTKKRVYLVGENQALSLLAKLADPDHVCPFHVKNSDDAFQALRDAEFVAAVGTHSEPLTIPIINVDICGRDGDYDATLWGIVRALYQFRQPLVNAAAPRPGLAPFNDDLYTRVLAAVAGPHGGRGLGTWTEPPDKCGLRFPETENHILLMESSRYLINELLMQRQAALPGPGYDNRTNGLPAWLMRHLQLFILRDFYESNSVPYQRYSAYALHNLADFAPDPEIREGARMVLDYLTAKFAAQSNELRRLAPYRRQPLADIVRPQLFFGPRVDAAASRMTFLTGAVNRVDDASEPKERPDDRNGPRFAHAHISSGASMVLSSLTGYRPPQLLFDVLSAPFSADALQVFNLRETSRDSDHFAFANEGIQITFGTVPFLLTAGGIPTGYGRDKEELALELAVRSNNAQMLLPLSSAVIADIADAHGKDNVTMVRATSLLPTLGGRRPHSLIAFHGADNYFYRRNSCIAPNFLCGLNLALPQKLVKAGACPGIALPPSVERLWNSNGGASGPFGCAIGKAGERAGDPTYTFERGMIVLWRWQGGAIGTLGAWVDYHGKDTQQDRIQLVFEGFPSSFMFTVWPTKDGAEFIQIPVTPTGYDPGTVGYTGGRAFLQPSNYLPGRGRWDFHVFGCKADEPITSPCAAVAPVVSVMYEQIDDPVREEPLACDARLPELPSGQSVLLLDAHAGCEPSRYGFYVAVIQDRCPRSCAGNGMTYGLVEAVPADQYRSFDEYERDFRRRNGNRVYAFENSSNEHTLPSGQTITFQYLPQSPTAWAISWSSDAALNTLAVQDMSLWPRAHGPIVENDSTGNVVLRNPRNGQNVQFDWTNVAAPRRQ